jgi:hypothetical protein
MPDFEDSNCPTWKNLIEGQVRQGLIEGQGGVNRVPAPAPKSPAVAWPVGVPPQPVGVRALGTPPHPGLLRLSRADGAMLAHAPAPNSTAAAVSTHVVAYTHHAHRHAVPVSFHPAHPHTHPPTQINLHDAVRRTISLEAGGKTYRLHPKVAVMLVRPRG